MKKVLVIGNGMLGSEVVTRLRTNGKLEVNVVDHPSFNIGSYSDVCLQCGGYDVIVNCAAYTNVDKAEEEIDCCMNVNAIGCLNLAKFLRNKSTHLIHISTDFVFDGTQKFRYNENAVPHPINVYGVSKLMGEIPILSIVPGSAVFRIQWTYGRGGNSFIDRIVHASRSFRTLKVVDDQIGQPTHVASVAACIERAIERQTSGLFHWSSQGEVSRADFARAILKAIGAQTEVQGISSSETSYAAKRPLMSAFDCQKAEGELELQNENWYPQLMRFMSNDFQK